jgi:hypothetical protein
MKTFSSISNELREAKYTIPAGFFPMRRNTLRFCGESVDVAFVVRKGLTHIVLNGNVLEESYEDLKVAEREFKLIRHMMEEMVKEDIPFGEIINEINIRV